MPMGFCYPGKGKSGDLAPRPECAPLWHERLLQSLPDIKLTLLIGSYTQNYYLDKTHSTLTARVAAWQDYMPTYLPLVHPSPRNTHWLQKKPWFQAELIPALRDSIKIYINQLVEISLRSKKGPCMSAIAPLPAF
jgi:uracil-DNA glycosylase